MPLDKFQEQVVNSTDNKILCLAAAGGGKTFTLLSRINHLIAEGVDPFSILALTFTNAAATEMRGRYEAANPGKIIPEFRTFHSFCYSLICKDYAVRTALGYSSVPGIASEEQEKEITERAKLQCKLTLNSYKLKYRDGLTRKEQWQVELYDKAVARFMRQENIITFDMLNSEVSKLFVADDPSTHRYKRQYKYLAIDEYQDVDPDQAAFMFSFTDSNIFCCGDALQCQPAGTLVTLANLIKKPIEDIVVGDRVLSYHCRDGRYVQHTSKNKPNHAKQVIATSKHFATNIVRVASNSHSSCYTKDHITYAKVHYEGNEHKFVTYLMSNEQGWWRVGSTQLFLTNGSGFGLRTRMYYEHGNRAWILGVYDNANDAWMTEQLVSYKYGIPQITWCHENVRYSQSDLSVLYSHLGDLSDNAKQCLSAYGRDINYPLFVRNQDTHIHFSKFHQFECRVGNLIPYIFDIIVPKYKPHSDERYKLLHNSYEQIVSITEEPDQLVYGLIVDGNHNYVGDDILTHNCIYQFRNCTNKFVKQLAKSPEWTKYRLLMNYRSTTQICDYANAFSATYADDDYRIEMIGQRDGEEVVDKDTDEPEEYNAISLDSVDDMIKDLTPLSGTSAILCRTNKEVDAVSSYLNGKGIVHTTKTGTKIPRLIECAISDEYMQSYLASYLTPAKYGEYIRLTIDKAPNIKWFLDTYGSNKKIADDSKKILKLREISTLLISTDDKIREIKKVIKVNIPPTDKDLFGQSLLYYIRDTVEEIKSNELYVGTIHSVKGLEYDNVCVANVGSYSFQLGSEEMNNLFYVAITRAKNRLFVYRI